MREELENVYVKIKDIEELKQVADVFVKGGCTLYRPDLEYSPEMFYGQRFGMFDIKPSGAALFGSGDWKQTHTFTEFMEEFGEKKEEETSQQYKLSELIACIENGGFVVKGLRTYDDIESIVDLCIEHYDNEQGFAMQNKPLKEEFTCYYNTGYPCKLNGLSNDKSKDSIKVKVTIEETV